MSIRVMSAVWDGYPGGGTELLALLALADWSDDNGRCYRTRGSSRVIVRDSYAYAPRERYIEQRRYRDYDEPRAGVGIRAPGVDVGVGIAGERW